MSPKVARKIAALEKKASDQAATLKKLSKKKAARRAKKDRHKQRRLLKKTGGSRVVVVAPRKRKVGACGNEVSEDSGEDDGDIVVVETGGGGVVTTKATIIGNDKEDTNEESDENSYEAEEFVWQHQSQKVGKFLIKWNTGRKEYTTVKPVLRDVPEETLSFIWRVYSKTPSVLAYIDKVAKENYKGRIVVKGYTSLKKYADEQGWAEEATEVQVPQVEKKIGVLKTPPAPQHPISVQKALDWVRRPWMAEAKPQEIEETAAPTATTDTTQPPRTPPHRVKPSATLETTPEKACAHPKNHVWEPQTSGAYVKSGRLGGLSCIGPCGRKFVAAKPCETARKEEFHPTIKEPAHLCKMCRRGMCCDCHVYFTLKDGGRRNTRSRGDP